jgi:hypothetical protein
VTVRHRTGKEARPCAPPRRWAFSLSTPNGGGQPRGRLGVLVVEEKHLGRILEQLGLEREDQELLRQQ